MNNNQNIENDIKIISRRKSKIHTSKNQDIKPKKFFRNSNHKTTQRSSNKFINELNSKNKLNLNKGKRRKSEFIRSNLNLDSYKYLI
jgi:hypothetical protein